MAIGGVVLNFVVKGAEATRDLGKITGALEDVRKKAGGADTALGKMGKAAKLGIAGAVAGAAVGIGVFVNFAKAAIDDAAAQDKLAASLKKSTKATQKGVDAAEDWISKTMFMTGVADDELRPALERAARSTKNLKDAQKLVGLALDISARTGKPLGTVMKALAKANDGNIKSLRGLGITLGDTANNAAEYGKEQSKLLNLQAAATAAYRDSGGSSKEYKSAMEKVAEQQKIVNGLAAEGVDWQKELGDEFGGAAAKAGGTLQGTWERIKLIFGEIGEAIGTAALPPLQEFADWFADPANIGKVQGWIDKLGEWATAIGTDVADKIKEFVAWLKSDEGKKAIENMTEAVKSLGNALSTVVDWLVKAKELLEWWFENGVTLPNVLGATPSDPRNSPPGSHLNPDQGEAFRPKIPRNAGANYQGPQGGTVVNIYNPKPERATISVASALRVSRPTVSA